MSNKYLNLLDISSEILNRLRALGLSVKVMVYSGPEIYQWHVVEDPLERSLDHLLKKTPKEYQRYVRNSWQCPRMVSITIDG